MAKQEIVCHNCGHSWETVRHHRAFCSVCGVVNDVPVPSNETSRMIYPACSFTIQQGETLYQQWQETPPQEVIPMLEQVIDALDTHTPVSFFTTINRGDGTNQCDNQVHAISAPTAIAKLMHIVRYWGQLEEES